MGLPRSELRSCFAVCMLISGMAWPSIGRSAEPPTPASEFQVSLSAVYSSRKISGSIGLTNPNSLGFVATTDSLGLSQASGFQENLEVRWKRWVAGLNYVPTTVSGQGTAVSGIEIGGGPIIAAGTPMTTTVDINLLLASVYYFVVQESNMELGLGVGFGQASIDVAFVPSVGQTSGYQGNTPFGFLSVRLGNRVGQFFYGVGINGIGFSIDGTSLSYFDTNLGAGYRLLDDRIKGDVVFGWRYINFAMSLDIPPTVAKTDIQMSGPYAGLRFVF
jgi:hypothetical protein